MLINESIIMAIKISSQDIKKYYNENQILYNFFWSQNALHYGIWDKDTQKLSDAIINTDKYVFQCLCVKENDTVLDAGCGVGGTSIFIAENSGAKVTGITLSDIQLNKAKEKAMKSKVPNLLNFSNQDFNNTDFQDEYFSKIFGIESICHAHKKEDFIKEAYRIMKTGGKIVIVDAFLTKIHLNEKEEQLYKKFLRGWAVPNLSSKIDFQKKLEEAGFKKIIFYDKLDSVRKSSKKIYQLGILFYPITLLFSFLRIIPKSMHGNTIASIMQRKLVNNNIVTYGVFVAEK